MSFKYSIKQNGERLEAGDEEVLITFLEMLDFSAEYLNELYLAETIRFCVEDKVILIKDTKKHSDKIDKIAEKSGFLLKNQ